jgi:hypothetical protein
VAFTIWVIGPKIALTNAANRYCAYLTKRNEKHPGCPESRSPQVWVECVKVYLSYGGYMKKVLILLLGLSMSSVGFAQYQDTKDHRGDLKLGPFASGNATVNASSVSDGWKTSPLGTAGGGALFELPFDRQSALDIAVVLDNRALTFYNEANSNIGVDYRFGYISLRPSVQYSGVLFGFGVGFPILATTTGYGGLALPKIETSAMNVLYEARIGGEVTLYRSKLGDLNARLEGSYAVNRILSRNYMNGGTDVKNNGPIASLEFGVMYLFNIMQQEPPPPLADR